MQIWSNLIDNAIKYSPENSTIWISGKIDEQYLTVTIKNEGKGISRDKQKIFLINSISVRNLIKSREMDLVFLL